MKQKEISINGLTKAQRKEDLQKAQNRLEKLGWTLNRYEDNGISGSKAIFEKNGHVTIKDYIALYFQYIIVAIILCPIALYLLISSQQDAKTSPELNTATLQNIKKITKIEFIEQIKKDMPEISSNIERCLSFSKKYGLKEIPDNELGALRKSALNLDFYYEKYVMERTEENPMLTFDLSSPLEKNWTAVVSLAHNVCFDFSSYAPNSQKSKAFKNKYKNLYLFRFKNFQTELQKFNLNHQL